MYVGLVGSGSARWDGQSMSKRESVCVFLFLFFTSGLLALDYMFDTGDARND